jgi:hypothetical protein
MLSFFKQPAVIAIGLGVPAAFVVNRLIGTFSKERVTRMKAKEEEKKNNLHRESKEKK